MIVPPRVLAAADRAARCRAAYYQRRREKKALDPSQAENRAPKDTPDVDDRLRDLAVENWLAASRAQSEARGDSLDADECLRELSLSASPPLSWKRLINEADERLFGRVCGACAKRFPVPGKEMNQKLCSDCRLLRRVEDRRGHAVTLFHCCDRIALGLDVICPCQAVTIGRDDNPPLRERRLLVNAMRKRDHLEEVALGEGFLEVIPDSQEVLGECPACSYFGKLTNHQYRRVFCPACPRTDRTHEALRGKPAVVYLVEFSLQHQRFVKVGIALKYAARQRLAGHARGGGRLAQLVETTHEHAVMAERQILAKYRKVKVRPIIPLPAAGDTECLAWAARTMDLEAEVEAASSGQ